MADKRTIVSIEEIAKVCGMTEDDVKKSFKELQKHGYISDGRDISDVPADEEFHVVIEGGKLNEDNSTPIPDWITGGMVGDDAYVSMATMCMLQWAGEEVTRKTVNKYFRDDEQISELQWYGILKKLEKHNALQIINGKIIMNLPEKGAR